MLAIFGFVDILRTIGILAFAVLCGWVIYRAMKSVDADEENNEVKEKEDD